MFFNGSFPKWSEFRKTDSHRISNWVQFKVPVSHMCLAGSVVACWSPTQEVVGWQGFEPFYRNDKYLSLNSVKHLGKTPLFQLLPEIFRPAPLRLDPQLTLAASTSLISLMFVRTLHNHLGFLKQEIFLAMRE